RLRSHRQEIGSLWANCGLNSEWAPLKQVLLHTPGPELSAADPESAQQLETPDWQVARTQHDAIAQAYRDAGISVHYVDPDTIPSPNQMFCADLVFMTPEGAILARPASTVRAGEERFIARKLADLGIPILRMLRGNAVFEGADAHWLDVHTVLIGRGLRTNTEAIAQISSILNEIGVNVIPVDLPVGTMHLMGILRFLDKDLVVTWPYRIAWGAVEAIRERGFEVVYIPDVREAAQGSALNFVTLGPREILMNAGNPITQAFYESQGVTCHTVDVSELKKAAGAIGCLTGILEREIV
ncbi:MAG: arginine deiminase family protein, partial [Anaerolineaceae bacterium]|nr:arginine deiminase family protein [Anaerolineaceae bacterium]